MKQVEGGGASRNEREYINELEYKVRLLSTFIDGAEAGLYVIDYETGEILFANKKTAAFSGEHVSVEEIFGKNCWTLVSPDSKERCSFCPYKRLLLEDGTASEPYVWEQYLSGHNRWMKTISRVITWVDGRLAQMNTFIDITETKKMQQELDALAKEKEHRKLQQSLQAVLDFLPVPVRIIDLETHTVIYGNKATFDLFGIENPDDMLGKSAFAFMPEMQPDGMSSTEKAISLDNDDTTSAEFVCVTPGGELLDMLITARVIDYGGKKVSLGVMVDLSTEKKYKRMQQSLQEILDKMPVALRICDSASGEIVYANNACSRLFGYLKPDDMVGRAIFEMAPRYQSNGVESRELLGMLLSSEDSLTTEVEYISSSDDTIVARFTSCAINYKGKKCVLGIIRDMTAEKEQERMLLSAAEKEREANQLKSTFLSNMSHEIRTPMNAIIGLTEIELNKYPHNQAPEVYKKINISARNLLQIVNDILDLSKIEADKLELFPEEFELEDVLNSALLVVSPRLEGKRVELMLDVEMSLPRTLIGDRTRLWQILKNYLDNSAKFTKTGTIFLTVSEDKTMSTPDTIYISFAVEDTGIGMDEEQLHKAFMPYEQVYTELQKKYRGTGLGLPISKRICELMGGSMDIKSKPGRGTIVSFSIPFLRVKDEPKAKGMSDSLKGLNILAVDDDEMSLEIIGNLLENCGASFMTAASGEEAVRILLGRPDFDVILLDYVMDGLNGLETAAQIRDISSSIKLLMVTAYESMLFRNNIELYDIDDVIEKPFVPSRFVQKIRSVAGLGTDAPSAKKSYAMFTNTRVLVCEDNEFNQEVAIGMLEQFGIQADTAANGRHGIEMLMSGVRYDLILMDLHMPVMDGFEATKSIRENPKFDDVPIISLTADAMTGVINDCLDAGMNDYLSKPIEFDELHKIFIKWLPEGKRISEAVID